MNAELHVVRCDNSQAQAYVTLLHRHHQRPPGARFSLAVVDTAGLIRGVVMVGRPVARCLDDGWTLEVSRLCTDGCPNACSALYGAARRATAQLGYAKLITYIRTDEPGTSLRASGWRMEEEIRARSWNMPGRPRTDKTEIVRRQRWSVVVGQQRETHWPDVTRLGQEMLAL